MSRAAKKPATVPVAVAESPAPAKRRVSAKSRASAASRAVGDVVSAAASAPHLSEVPRPAVIPAPAPAAADPLEMANLQRLLDEREQLGRILEDLLEASTDGVVALDFRGHVVHASASLREGTTGGMETSELPDSPGGTPPPENCLPRAVRQRLRREAAEMSPGQTRRFDLDWNRPDRGTERYRVTATAGADPAGSGRLVTFFAFFDRTRESTLEHELAEARNLAALGQMAATVAHELRNPLGAIQGFAGLLSRDLTGQPELLRQADRILRGVEGANRIVADLLEYTRPVAPRREAVSVESLLAESLSGLHATGRTLDRVEVDLRIDPDLPSVLCDARLVSQALSNLYTNAIQAMGEAGGTLAVRARATGPTARPDRLRIVVRDSGCGLGADEVARIFQPFYTTRPGGTGLGLPLVRRIVEAHGGHVHVVSAPGRGTSVVLDLPAAGLELPGTPGTEDGLPAGEEMAG